jgi:hypothetical protein
VSACSPPRTARAGRLLRGLVAWGLSGVAVVVSDAHEGLNQAIAATLPGGLAALAHPRHVHLLTWVPKSAQAMVATLVRMIFAQSDADQVKAQFDRIVDQLADKFPAAAEFLTDAEADLLAFSTFPVEHERRIWSNNGQKRLNKDLRRRTDVAGIFPNRPALIRLCGAVLAEQHDEWAVARRSMSAESLTNAHLAVIAGEMDTEEVTTAELEAVSRPTPQLAQWSSYTTSLDLTTSLPAPASSWEADLAPVVALEPPSPTPTMRQVPADSHLDRFGCLMSGRTPAVAAGAEQHHQLGHVPDKTVVDYGVADDHHLAVPSSKCSSNILRAEPGKRSPCSTMMLPTAGSASSARNFRHLPFKADPTPVTTWSTVCPMEVAHAVTHATCRFRSDLWPAQGDPGEDHRPATTT